MIGDDKRFIFIVLLTTVIGFIAFWCLDNKLGQVFSLIFFFLFLLQLIFTD
ncbi:hypothetical protein [Enterococcus termitis]|uniref:hypothetical protein n=1 Tax=Enterococcus termitis TaxID=332950 RepID=UPI0014717842|nr:hypothetical protein [Enterococcus termitis]